MNTFLQLLRVAFWMLPLQRALTLLGASICFLALLLDQQGYLQIGSEKTPTLMLALNGLGLMLVVPLLAGGALFRMLSASRALQLLPGARRRLLTGMIGMVLISTLLLVAGYWAAFQRLPLKFRPDFEAISMMYVLSLSFVTQCTIGMFIASRGPAWALLMVGVWQLPTVVMRLAGVEDVPRLMTGSVGLAMVPLAWLIFGIWYMRAGPIQRSGWARGSMTAAIAPAAVAVPLSREQAMTRWVLGASTPKQIGLQWALGAAVLVGVQLLMGYNSPPRAVASMAYGTLSFCALVIGAVSLSIAGRSRGLWLAGGRLRGELYAWCERLMLRVCLALALPFVLMGVALWWWLPARPVLPGMYLLLAMLVPALAAAWFGLMLLRRRLVVDVACGVAIAAGWYYGLAQPMYMASNEPRWKLLAAEILLVVVLRQLAVTRWRRADWPRAQRVDPVS